MGTLEKLDPNKRLRRQRDDSPPRGEILIFPGVRRVRHSTVEEPETPKKKRTRPKRDRIELPD